MGCHFLLQCMKVKSESEGAQSCPTLSHCMDGSLPGSSIHGIFQARVLEWDAIAFSKSKMHSVEIILRMLISSQASNVPFDNHTLVLFFCLTFFSITHLRFSHLLVRRRQWHPTPVLLPGRSHGQRSLVGCSPMGSPRVRHD